jgi:dimethylargininase
VIAITREISDDFAKCELTHLERVPIDVDVARAQHEEYVRVLAELGCRVIRISSGEHLPDSVFIEDTAVVLDEVAIICRPGAESRRAEVDAVAGTLWLHRKLEEIQAPATIDGGDVLVAGRTLFIGRSSRTNDEAIAQCARVCEPLGYQIRPVEVRECLHLKSAVTALDNRRLLVNPDWIDTTVLTPFEVIDVHPDEPAAANVVRLDAALVAAAAFPKTASRLEHRGYLVRTVDVSEIAKAEGAVTCCSLIFSTSQETGFAL